MTAETFIKTIISITLVAVALTLVFCFSGCATIDLPTKYGPIRITPDDLFGGMK